MNNVSVLVLVWLAGLFLGAVFFGGLWWTVRKSVVSARPAVWFFGSLLLRTGIVLAGFHLVSRGRWERLLACLLGFVIARLIVILLVRSLCPQAPARAPGPATEHPTNPEQEAIHAPGS